MLQMVQLVYYNPLFMDVKKKTGGKSQKKKNRPVQEHRTGGRDSAVSCRGGADGFHDAIVGFKLDHVRMLRGGFHAFG